jgi:hypothetical protein
MSIKEQNLAPKLGRATYVEIFNQMKKQAVEYPDVPP